MNLIESNVKKLYFVYLLSALGSTLIATIYSTFDMICIGQYAGPMGSAAVSCSNPFWTIMLAPGILLGMGGAVMMSNRRGGGNEESAQRYFSLSIYLSVIISLIIFFVTTVFTKELLILFGAEGEVLDLALTYIKPVTYASPSFAICASAATFVRNDGEAMLPTVATVIGGIVNILGDIFFVFDFGLGLGVRGAGFATALAQIVSFLIICGYFFTRKCKLKLTKVDKFWARLLKICTVGLSAFIAEVSFGGVTVFFNNLIMKTLSPDHLAVFGTVSSALIMLQCLYAALGTALQPIVSANFGAKEKERVKKVFLLSLLCSGILGVIFTVLTQSFSLEILKIYMNVSDRVTEIGPGILRKYMAGVGIIGFSMVSSYFLQSILYKTSSAALSILRGLVLPILFAACLTFIFGAESIWFAMPLAELVTLFISVFLVLRSYKKL